jgi:hypothetical protein
MAQPREEEDIKLVGEDIYCIQKGGHSGAEKIPRGWDKCRSSAHRVP